MTTKALTLLGDGAAKKSSEAVNSKDDPSDWSVPQSKYELDVVLLDKAVRAMLRSHQRLQQEQDSKHKNLLQDKDVPVFVNFNLEVGPGGKNAVKPVPVRIPHSYRKVYIEDGSNGATEDYPEPEICLIVKDDRKDAVKELVQKFGSHLSCIKKVMRLSSLRTKHAYSPVHRRQLLRSYELFLADDAIFPMLTTILGNEFIRAKKQPLPISLKYLHKLPQAVQRCLSSTYYYPTVGTCVSIQVGHTSMPGDHLVANIKRVAEIAGSKLIYRRWANIRSLSLMTHFNAIHMPFYQKTPLQLMELAQLAGLPRMWNDKTEAEMQHEDQIREEQRNARKKRHDNSNNGDNDGADGGKKRKSKSPLLKALKKQKLQEAQAKHVDASDKKELVTQEDQVGHKAVVLKDNEGDKKKKHKTLDKEIKTNVKLVDDSILVEKKMHREEISGASNDSAVTDVACDKKDKEKDLKRKTPALSETSDGSLVPSPGSNIAVTLNEAAKESTEDDDKKNSQKNGFDSEPAADNKGRKDKVVGSQLLSNERMKGKHTSDTVVVQSAKLREGTKSGKSELPPQSVAPFMPATCFGGSKLGYIFQKGKLGLGYYQDSPPAADKEALHAILQSTRKVRSVGASGRNKNKRRGRS